MMTQEMMQDKIANLKELKRMKAEIETMITDAENELKVEMTERKLDEVVAGQYKIIWREVISQRIDTAAFKKARPKTAAQFMVATVSRPFKVY